MTTGSTFNLNRTTAISFAVLAAVLASAWIAAAIGDPTSFEITVFRIFNDLPDWLQVPTWPWMQLGALAFVPVAAVGAHALWQQFSTTAAVFMAGVGGWLTALVVKALVGRGRPQALLPDVELRSDTTGYGFVSGHTTVAFALATVIGSRLGPIGKTIAYLVAAGVGLLRLYVGAHLPLDVVGGAALGTLAGGLVVAFSWPRADHEPPE